MSPLADIDAKCNALRFSWLEKCEKKNNSHKFVKFSKNISNFKYFFLSTKKKISEKFLWYFFFPGNIFVNIFPKKNTHTHT